jgi:hypothetical protein
MTWEVLYALIVPSRKDVKSNADVTSIDDVTFSFYCTSRNDDTSCDNIITGDKVTSFPVIKSSD